MNRYLYFSISRLMLATCLAIGFTCLTVNAASRFEMDDDLWQDLEQPNNALFSYPSIFTDNQSSLKDDYLTVVGLIIKNKLSQAKEKLVSLMQKKPNEPVYINLTALINTMDNNFQEAKQNYKRAIELDENNIQAYTGLAKVALDEKKISQAEKYIYIALEKNPDAINAYLVLADIVMQQGGIDAVEKMLLDASTKRKGNLETELPLLKLLGKIYARKKHPEKLLYLAEDLVERYKGDSSALSYLARVQIANEDSVGAEQTLRQIIAQEGNDAQHRFFLARLLSQQTGKESEILSLLNQAEANLKNPNFILAFKAYFFIKKNKLEQAFAIAEQIDASSPELSTGKILKGDIFLAEKKYQEALNAYQQAYQITPNPKVLDAILKILMQQNKSQVAVKLLKKELTINEANMHTQLRLANIYRDLHQYDLSIKHYEALLAKQKGNVMILNNLAIVYSQQNNPKALKLAELAYQKAPHSAALADTYGYILLKNGNMEKSLDLLKKAVEMAPELEEIQLHLAEAYIANKDKAHAQEILRKLIDKDSPKKPEALKLMGRL